MDGKVSEIIDNVLDTDDYNINSNTQESFNSANSWTKLTYLDNKLLKKEPLKNNLPSPIETEKEEKNNTNINSINIINNKKEEKKILNENLFKGKGFRTNIDFFLKNNSENLSLSGITDITSLSEYPNVFTCNMPRPGTNRYKKANKSNMFYNSFYGKDNNKNKKESKINNKNNGNNININNFGQNSINKKTLPKIKNSQNQIEERKNTGNKIYKNKNNNK